MLVTNMWPSPIKANVWESANFYVVPKRDGRVIIGATEEPNAYDRSPTLRGVAELSRAAVNLIPALARATLEAFARRRLPAFPCWALSTGGTACCWRPGTLAMASCFRR